MSLTRCRCHQTSLLSGQPREPSPHRHHPPRPVSTAHTGGAPATAPARAGIWAAHAAGPGTQTLTWPDRGGNWTVAAMNADGSRPVAVRLRVAAALPSLRWIAAGLLAGGVPCWPQAWL